MSEREGDSFEEYPPKQEEHSGLLARSQPDAKEKMFESTRREREQGTLDKGHRSFLSAIHSLKCFIPMEYYRDRVMRSSEDTLFNLGFLCVLS